MMPRWENLRAVHYDPTRVPEAALREDLARLFNRVDVIVLPGCNMDVGSLAFVAGFREHYGNCVLILVRRSLPRDAVGQALYALNLGGASATVVGRLVDRLRSFVRPPVKVLHVEQLDGYSSEYAPRQVTYSVTVP